MLSIHPRPFMTKFGSSNNRDNSVKLTPIDEAYRQFNATAPRVSPEEKVRYDQETQRKSQELINYGLTGDKNKLPRPGQRIWQA